MLGNDVWCTSSSCPKTEQLHSGTPEDKISNQEDDRSIRRSNMAFAYVSSLLKIVPDT